LAVYPDCAIRWRCRGLLRSRLHAAGASRRKRSATKSDVVVALAMSALGSLHQGRQSEPNLLTYYREMWEQQSAEERAQQSSQPPTPAELLREEQQDDEIDPEDQSSIEIYEQALGSEPSAPAGAPIGI
jgi:hypothetical protein